MVSSLAQESGFTDGQSTDGQSSRIATGGMGQARRTSTRTNGNPRLPATMVSLHHEVRDAGCENSSLWRLGVEAMTPRVRWR